MLIIVTGDNQDWSKMKTKLRKIEYVYKLCRKRARERHLSTLRQMVEIAYLQLTRGIGYSKYHFAQMWHRDATWDYKTSFLSHRNFVNKIHEINERKFHGVTQFKPLEKSFFQLFNIPTAKHLGTLNIKWGITCDGKNLKTSADLEDLLNQYIDEKICFKLLEGDGGRGFKAYHIINKKDQILVRHLSDAKEYSMVDLFNLLQEESLEGWLLEKYIVQHPVLQALNASSINTIRMYVFQDKTDKLSTLGSFLRIGRKSSIIDNSSAGGLVSRIDQDTGALQQTCGWSPELLYMPVHPDHGAQIEGTVIPYWQEARELGKKTLLALPRTRFAGLDVAITPDGPIMVELNIQPSSDGLSYLQIQTARVFDS